MKPFEVAHLAIGKNVGLMTGSRLMRNGDDCLIIHGLKASRKYKSVSVTYQPGKDLFSMTFVAKRTDAFETISDLYVDQLREVFESKTGLYTSL